jgi:hypothetical protein
LEHPTEVGTWRAGLNEGKPRTLNHPAAIWSHWRRSLKPATPACQYIRGAKASHKNGKPVYWPGDAIRRAASAIREVYSTDL